MTYETHRKPIISGLISPENADRLTEYGPTPKGVELLSSIGIVAGVSEEYAVVASVVGHDVFLYGLVVTDMTDMGTHILPEFHTSVGLPPIDEVHRAVRERRQI